MITQSNLVIIVRRSRTYISESFPEISAELNNSVIYGRNYGIF